MMTKKLRLICTGLIMLSSYLLGIIIMIIVWMICRKRKFHFHMFEVKWMEEVWWLFSRRRNYLNNFFWIFMLRFDDFIRFSFEAWEFWRRNRKELHYGILRTDGCENERDYCGILRFALDFMDVLNFERTI